MNKLLSIIIFAAVVFSAASVFAADLPADVQNCPEIHVINTLMENGVVEPYADGRFRPDHRITREEAVCFTDSLLRRLLPEENTDLAEASELAFAEGDSSLRAYLTRAELADMLYNYLKTLPSFDNSTYWFPDVSEDNLSIGYVRAKNIMFGQPDGCFHPEGYVTRAEFCNALYAISGFSLIYAADNLPREAVLNTPYISQLSPVYAVVGCEGAALLMGLKAKGYAEDVGLREFLDNMPKHESNPAKGYVGSPYIAGQYNLRTTIYPAPLAEYGSLYGRVTDISDSSPRELQAELLSGNPVVVYATMRWGEPRYRNYKIEGESQSLLSNNHAVLVDGYNRDTGEYHISDPYNDYDTSAEYKYWINGEAFEKVYNIRRQAIVIE